MNEEKTRWRDLNMSLQHRKYGLNCPATDIDFILCEYDYATPVALMEYKNENCGKVVIDSNIKTLIKLGDMAGLPVFLVKYKRDFSKFYVLALNKKGKEKLTRDKLVMTEQRYVSFLYYLRGKKTPDSLVFDQNGKLKGE